MSYLAAAIGPGGSAFSTVVGLIGLVAGVAGLLLVRRGDPVALPVGIHSVVLVALTLTIGRVYWGYASGPLLATYLPAAVVAVASRLASGRGDVTPALYSRSATRRRSGTEGSIPPANR